MHTLLTFKPPFYRSTSGIWIVYILISTTLPSAWQSIGSRLRILSVQLGVLVVGFVWTWNIKKTFNIMVRKPITLLRFYSNLFQFKCEFPHKISWRLRSEGWEGSLFNSVPSRVIAAVRCYSPEYWTTYWLWTQVGIVLRICTIVLFVEVLIKVELVGKACLLESPCCFSKSFARLCKALRRNPKRTWQPLNNCFCY